MKKRLIQLLLSVIAVSLSVSIVASNWRHKDIIETDVAAQTETTEINDNINFESTETESNNIIEEYYNGWTTSTVNVRSNPSLESEVLQVFSYNTPVRYYKLNNEWAVIEYNLGIAYMSLNYISNEKVNYINYTGPITSGFKSYMPYTAITSKSSKQYQLQTIAYTGNYGIRMINERYCVAIGTGFNASVGKYFDLVLENNTVIPCVVADIKADQDTDINNMVTTSNGCLTEFLVDSNTLDKNAKRMGDISYCKKEWKSRVVSIIVYDIEI